MRTVALFNVHSSRAPLDTGIKLQNASVRIWFPFEQKSYKMFISTSKNWRNKEETFWT